MEQYKKILKQAGSIYIIKGIEFLLVLCLFITLTRVLTQQQYGIYSILNITLLFLTGILGLGLPDFINRDLPGKSEDLKKRSFGQVFTFLLAFLAVAAAVLILIAYIILHALGYQDLLFSTILIILCACIITLGILVESFVYSNKEPAKSKSIEFLFRSIWTVPIIILGFAFYLDIDLIFTVKFLVTFLTFIGIIIFFKSKGMKFLIKVDKDTIKQGIIFGLPLSSLIVSQWVITGSDRYILGFFHSAAAVGIYSYIYSILDFIWLFSSSLIALTLYPYIVESYNKNNIGKSKFLLNAAIKYILILILPALLGFLILGREIITLVSGPKYLSAVSLIPFLIFFPVAKGLNIIFNYVLMLKKKTKSIALIYTVGMVINLILNFILIPKYSYFGAAVATTLSYLLIVILFFSRSASFINLDFKFLKIPEIFLSVVIMAASIFFLHPENFFFKVLTIVLGTSVYFISLYLTKAYVKEEMDLIRSFLPMAKKQ